VSLINQWEDKVPPAPTIITIYEIGKENSTHFISTEFGDGNTLRSKMVES